MRPSGRRSNEGRRELDGDASTRRSRPRRPTSARRPRLDPGGAVSVVGAVGAIAASLAAAVGLLFATAGLLSVTVGLLSATAGLLSATVPMGSPAAALPNWPPAVAVALGFAACWLVPVGAAHVLARLLAHR